jgi:glycosyltransferase involved in cell wall biosynthesis
VAAALDAVAGMRILIVISGLGFGGAERQVVLVSRELVRRGHQVLIYTLNNHVPRRPELSGSGVELAVDQKRWRFDPSVLLRLRRTVRKWRADVVHSFLYDGDFYARLACCGLNLPLLNSERNDNYVLSRLQRWGYRLTAGMVDGVVANSYAGAAFARRMHGIDEGRVHVVWNGIDLDEIDARLARSTRPARQLQPMPQAKLGCVVGAIKPQKDHMLALQVCRELADRDASWRFLFVGDSLLEGGAYKRQVLDEQRRLGLEDIVTFTGVRTDVPEIVASCDVLFVTSRFEGFPNVVLEAMSCATPVASTDYSDVRRILPCEWQVARTRSARELADIVQRCEREGDLLRRAQRRWVETHGRVAHAADAMLAVYGRYLRPPLDASSLESAR